MELTVEQQKDLEKVLADTREDNIKINLDRSLMLVTALAPTIGPITLADLLPAKILIATFDLDSQGDWFSTPEYGYVWQPSVISVDTGWRPYTRGRWASTDRGWTWMSDEPMSEPPPPGSDAVRRLRRRRSMLIWMPLLPVLNDRPCSFTQTAIREE